MNCDRCGKESMMFGDLHYCSGCFKPFNDCHCSS